MMVSVFSFGVVGNVEGLEQPPDSCTIRADTGISGCPDVGTVTPFDTNYPTDAGGEVSGSMCCMFGSINYVIQIAFALLMALVVAFILIGAYNFLTAAGDTDKVAAGRNYVLYALIGLIVASLAWALPQLVRMIVGI